MWLADISALSHILARAKNPTLFFSLFKELVDLGVFIVSHDAKHLKKHSFHLTCLNVAK
jgi:ABC-type Mn2+/Zn2+ transport system ATPase subunit